MNTLKNFKAILPDYPRTPHVPYKPNISLDDIVSSNDEAKVIFQYDVEITEKVDGANCGMALFNNEPIIRNRSHILSKGYVKDTPAKKQFASAFNWAYENKAKFEALNEHGTFCLYGEWLIAQHGLKYDKLPAWFVVFDLYNYDAEKFVETKLAREIVSECGFKFVPQLYFGKIKDFEQLENLTIQPSQYATKGLREGIYLKISDADWVTNRFKMVREDFVQGALWNKDKISKNSLAK